MVTWHGLGGDAVGTMWGVSYFISGWFCLSLSACRQIMYFEQMEEAFGRSVPASQCISISGRHWPVLPSQALLFGHGPECVWSQYFPFTPLLLTFLPHMA